MNLKSYTPDVIAGIIVFAMVCLLLWACMGCSVISTPDQDRERNRRTALDTLQGLEENQALLDRAAELILKRERQARQASELKEQADREKTQGWAAAIGGTATLVLTILKASNDVVKAKRTGEAKT